MMRNRVAHLLEMNGLLTSRLDLFSTANEELLRRFEDLHAASVLQAEMLFVMIGRLEELECRQTFEVKILQVVNLTVDAPNVPGTAAAAAPNNARVFELIRDDDSPVVTTAFVEDDETKMNFFGRVIETFRNVAIRLGRWLSVW